MKGECEEKKKKEKVGVRRVVNNEREKVADGWEMSKSASKRISREFLEFLEQVPYRGQRTSL